ncbi:uncharacterized protein LOC141629092 [Silene latifolia]|uniref:uncharacterized protein LOC141629092 n=1 Tax=Silene latifolia TaxID=37657 RepID=UPI003D77A770
MEVVWLVERMEGLFALYGEMVSGNRKVQGGLNSCHPSRWTEPEMGRLKVNVDGVVLTSSGNGIGVVVRDWVGVVRRAGVSHVRQRWEPDIVEAKAALVGLQIARQMGVEVLVLESDSLSLIKALKTRNVPRSYLG